MRAQRSTALACAIALFALGFSLDDLRVLRVPGYWLALAGAALCIAVGPLWLGRRFAFDHLLEDAAAFAARVDRARRVGALGLLLVALLFVAWLAVFSSGVPPWAR